MTFLLSLMENITHNNKIRRNFFPSGTGMNGMEYVCLIHCDYNGAMQGHVLGIKRDTEI